MTIKPKDLFFPNRAIRSDNKKFFAGRKGLLHEAHRRVGEDGLSAVIYGDRGVGKTSFGWQLLENLNHEGYKCVWFQCQDYLLNVENVLAGIMQESLADYSLKSHFPKLYEGNVKDTIARKYGINFGISNSNFTFKRNDGNSSVGQKIKSIDPLFDKIFRDVIVACKSLYPDTELVIFLDEFDSIPDRSGIGQMIKAIDNIRFVIIGIADNVDEIVADHQSADRKLADCKFKIPGLAPDEVQWLFDNVEASVLGQVKFDNQFRDRVIYMSNGYPYLVQQFGYFAMQAAQDANPLQNPLMVTKEYLSQAINRLFRDKAESRLFAPLVKVLEGKGQARKEILRIVANSVKLQTQEEIKSQTSPNLRKHVETNCKALIDDGILKLTDVKKLRFANPEARILTQLHFDRDTE